MTISSRIWQKCSGNLGSRFLYNVLDGFLNWELVKSVGSNSSLSLPFMMKVMVWCYVNNAHKVMTPIIFVMFNLVLMELIQQSASNCYLCGLIDKLKWWKLMQREMRRFMILLSRAGCFFLSRNTTGRWSGHPQRRNRWESSDGAVHHQKRDICLQQVNLQQT